MQLICVVYVKVYIVYIDKPDCKMDVWMFSNIYKK